MKWNEVRAWQAYALPSELSRPLWFGHYAAMGDVTNRQLTAMRNVDESEKAKSCSDRGRPWNHYKSGTFLRTTARGATSIRKRLWGKGNQQR